MSSPNTFFPSAGNIKGPQEQELLRPGYGVDPQTLTMEQQLTSATVTESQNKLVRAYLCNNHGMTGP